MTLSNFDWTDKDSVKWFILLPSGHEGPYSLNDLLLSRDKKKISGEVNIWAEGLNSPVTLNHALTQSSEEEEMAVPPPVPEEEIPPIPLPEETEEVVEEVIPEIPQTLAPKKKLVLWPYAVLVLIIALVGSVFWYAGKNETFEIRRMSKMSPELKDRIMSENSFQGWNKKIFFKEYVPQDYSHIWLITSSFQTCDVEAVFTSLDEKLLSMKDEKISFRSRGNLAGHIVEFQSFDFLQGNKIIPGMYELDVKATNCKWDGFLPKIMNGFIGPDSNYQARTKVILFSSGAEDYHENLKVILKKKEELLEREKTAAELFWEDLFQKFQTLEAISLQIEQHFLDFLDGSPSGFKNNLKPMVDEYTRKFGSFLTSFVVENENYFNSLNAKGDSQKRNYELMVRLTAKKIGFESMTYIEEFQNLKKNPGRKDLDAYSERIKKTFAGIKKEISEKLIQVSEDQVKSQEK